MTQEPLQIIPRSSKGKKETPIKKEILKYLKTVQCSYFFSIAQGFRSTVGVSDILGVINGKMVAIEVKKPDNKKGMTPMQEDFQQKIRLCGGIAVCVRSVEETQRIIESLHDVLYPAVRN